MGLNQWENELNDRKCLQIQRKKIYVTFWDIYFNKYDKRVFFNFTGWYVHTSTHTLNPNPPSIYTFRSLTFVWHICFATQYCDHVTNITIFVYMFDAKQCSFQFTLAVKSMIHLPWILLLCLNECSLKMFYLPFDNCFRSMRLLASKWWYKNPN